ncbi:hypothetical protein J3R83DRAFT_7036 [Lanmaoa asiatica]|nr:hypothetical protein J3R83DRAFT_7036 [Lanmaoa asiatica]
MTRNSRRIQDPSSDDDAPEVVSHLTSKADVKRNQKVLHDFEAEEKARRKARNRERDQKLKERAHVTKGGKPGEKLKEVRFVDQESEGEDEGDSGEDDGNNGHGDDVEARMLRAMRDAADEVASGEGEDDDDDDDSEFKGFGRGTDLSDDDAEMSLGESDSMDAEAPTDEEEIDEDEETTPLQANNHKFSRKADYLADDLFAAAFASQNLKPHPKKNSESTQQQTAKKRRRRSIARPKDLVIGGRTIRTLPQPSDPRSQATARSIPSARARRFVDQNLAMKGEQAFLKAKKKGWERRPANVGVMKYQGAPHGFARSTR